jgi:hypothetical protein
VVQLVAHANNSLKEQIIGEKLGAQKEVNGSTSDGKIARLPLMTRSLISFWA